MKMKMTKYQWGRIICSALILIISYEMGYGCLTWQYWVLWVLSWCMVIFTDLDK